MQKFLRIKVTLLAKGSSYILTLRAFYIPTRNKQLKLISYLSNFFLPQDTLGLTTLWDDQLSFILSPALWSYELERCSSAANVGNKDFQEAVKRNVEEGFTFKGFPTQFPHRDPNKMMAFCLKCVILFKNL